MTLLADRLAAIRASLPADIAPVSLGVILGSGLGGLVDEAHVTRTIAYRDIDGMTPSTAPGHAGALKLGTLQGRPVALCAGRLHLYEGAAPLDVAMTAYLLHVLGARTLIVTNAAGALNPDFRPGDVMLIDDHINFSGADPLQGEDNPDIGPRFPDMSRAYHPGLRDQAARAAPELDLALRRGVYAGVRGPSLETSAERRFYRAMGADAVGMSTVLEVIAANHCGMRVLGLSAITNMATGGADQQPDTIEEVLKHAETAGRKIAALLLRLAPQL
ncbi:MAG: purine-nucleoside phosphorylase [Caulobacterales bacterium]|nr:purine-nucleoside phosphorylase [Caulobacterales bacterium]